MTEHGHPIRKAKIHTFKRQDSEDGGANWIARFYPYGAYPVFFHGVDEVAAIASAEAVRTEAIEKHEAACIARQKAGEASKQRAADKRKTKGD